MVRRTRPFPILAPSTLTEDIWEETNEWEPGVVLLLSLVLLFVTPWTTAHQASLSFMNSCSLLKLMSIESVMQSNHLILCHPPLLLPSVFPSIRVFSNELALRIRWPKYWSLWFSISSPKTIEDWFPLGWTGLISLQSKELSRVLKYQYLSRVVKYLIFLC